MGKASWQGINSRLTLSSPPSNCQTSILTFLRNLTLFSEPFGGGRCVSACWSLLSPFLPVTDSTTRALGPNVNGKDEWSSTIGPRTSAPRLQHTLVQSHVQVQKTGNDLFVCPFAATFLFVFYFFSFLFRFGEPIGFLHALLMIHYGPE